jgi:hypothetical protein
MNKELLVTIPLDSLITQLFGEERRYYVPIEPVIAQVIDYHIKTSNLELAYKIQYKDYDEVDRFSKYLESTLDRPRLWIYRDWYDSDQNYQRRKAHSIRDKEEADMLRANIKIVAKAYREFTGIDDVPTSEAKAYALVKGNKLASIQMLGVELSKLITKKE